MKLLEEGLLSTEEGTEKIMAWLRVVKPKDVVSFTRFLQYYAQFLPGFSELCAPLNKVKSKKKRGLDGGDGGELYQDQGGIPGSFWKTTSGAGQGDNDLPWPGLLIGLLQICDCSGPSSAD